MLFLGAAQEEEAKAASQGKKISDPNLTSGKGRKEAGVWGKTGRSGWVYLGLPSSGLGCPSLNSETSERSLGLSLQGLSLRIPMSQHRVLLLMIGYVTLGKFLSFSGLTAPRKEIRI
jgi:hypothetical protein